jgi:uncharacterized membrane protein HdeD (DUF308 family)
VTTRTTLALAPPKHPRVVVLITALRAVLAFGIGIALLLIPERGESALVGFMGAYFLVSGLVSLAWARRGPMLNRLAFVAGTTGVATGVFVLAYTWAGGQEPSRDQVLMVLGLVVGFTGVLHIVGGFMVGERIDRWPTGHILLGLLEVVLGTVLLFAPVRRDLIVAAATVWAFTAGSVLAFDAIRAYRRWSAAGVGESPAAGSSPPGQQAPQG